MAEDKHARCKRAFSRAKEVVIYPLLTGFMLGLGTVLGKRIGEWYMEYRRSSSQKQLRA